MSRRKNRSGPSRGRDRSSIEPGTKDGSNKSGKQRVSNSAATREVIESIVIAFVLAFMFRTFEAEAFVIPTGSMAPTLMGRHKDLECEKCGFPYQVSASAEVDTANNSSTNLLVVSCECPNCRHRMTVRPDADGKVHRSYKGDRILVGKFPYRFHDPDRWDVSVFKYPGGAKTNFIKRIVGLPGETLRISHGDLLTRKNDETEWKSARKPLAKVRAMMQMVYDNDYLRDEIVTGEWPARWSAEPEIEGPAGWTPSDDGKSFSTDGSAPEIASLRYRHLVNAPRDWPELITDFTAYNTASHSPNRPRQIHRPLWVGDLAVECRMEVKSSEGDALFELVEGGRRFTCRIDVATGEAALLIDGMDEFAPVGKTNVIGPGVYTVFFANFDDKLFLSIDGDEVSFEGLELSEDGPTSYPALGNNAHTTDDLEPVWIGSGGAALDVSHLKVYRDIYYIAERGNGMVDHDHADFRLEEDQFLALGDNSAESKDGRLWEAEGNDYFVSRELLIGKALVIYWPHSLDQIPGTEIPICFFPNFQRMRFVR